MKLVQYNTAYDVLFLGGNLVLSTPRYLTTFTVHSCVLFKHCHWAGYVFLKHATIWIIKNYKTQSNNGHI